MQLTPEQKEPRERVSELDFIKTFSIIKLRETVTKSLLAIYVGTLSVTFFIYLIQGFHWHGFDLGGYLHWLGGITVGQTAMILRSVFTRLFEME